MSSDESDETVGLPEPPSPSLLGKAVQFKEVDEKSPRDHCLVKHTGRLTSLQDVQKEQRYIETMLASPDSTINIGGIESRLSDVGMALKTISLSNQSERKRITEHRQAMEASSIKQQLTSLAERQRTLLACFTRQKELSSKLHVLKTAVSQRSSTVPLIDPTASTVQLSKPVPKSLLATKPGGMLPGKEKDRQIITNLKGSETIAKQPSSMVKSVPPAIVPTASGAIKPGLSGPTSADLAQPVPLDTLIQHGLLAPGKNCITAVLMGCQFTGSLLSSGIIVSSDGKQHHTPQQWLSSCWLLLGHKRKFHQKQAYKVVLYKGESLISHCQKYSYSKGLKPLVSTYLHHQSRRPTAAMPVTKTQPLVLLPPKLPPPKKHSIDEVLARGRVLVHPRPCRAMSLPLPTEFWDRSYQLSCDLRDLMINELTWH